MYKYTMRINGISKKIEKMQFDKGVIAEAVKDITDNINREMGSFQLTVEKQRR